MSIKQVFVQEFILCYHISEGKPQQEGTDITWHYFLRIKYINTGLFCYYDYIEQDNNKIVTY